MSNSSSQRVDRHDLVDQVARDTGLTKKTVDLVTKSMVEMMIKDLQAGNSISLRGHSLLGDFNVVTTPGRKIYVPVTGSADKGRYVTVPKRYRVQFRPGRSLKMKQLKQSQN